VIDITRIVLTPSDVRAVWFVLLAGCSVRASCNSGNRLDMDKARGFVSDVVEKYTTLEPTKVVCPDDVKAEQGARVVCTFEVGGVPGTLAMQQTDTKGSVSVSSMTGIIASSQLEAKVQAELEKRGIAATIACGARVHPSKPGDVITCDARRGVDVVGRVPVTIKDEQNNVTFNFVPSEEPTR